MKLKNNSLGRFARTEDTAKFGLFLLSDDPKFITGDNLGINGGRF